MDKFFNSDITNLKNIFYIGTLIDLTYFFNNIVHLIDPLTKKLNIRIHPIAFCGGRFSFYKIQKLINIILWISNIQILLRLSMRLYLTH